MEIQRGMRDKLEKYVDTTKMIEVKLNIVGNAVYDFSCFGVDINNKLSDDRYMVFYNQKTSPNGEIEYIEGNNCAVFKVMTNSIPAAIQKITPQRIAIFFIGKPLSISYAKPHPINSRQNSLRPAFSPTAAST